MEWRRSCGGSEGLHFVKVTPRGNLAEEQKSCPSSPSYYSGKQLLTKYSKTEVGYRLAAAGANRRCGNYTKHTCTSIEGRVEAGDVCNIWKLNVPLSTSDGLAE